MWSKMYDLKAKDLFFKEISNISCIDAQKLSCIDQKVWKIEAKWKAFNHTLVRGHICSFLLVRYVTWLHAICVWLNWIDHWNFILDYGLVHTWFTHTTHKSNVQWMPISFVWLYMFKCDLCVLNCLMIKPKKIFECFMCF